MQNKDLEDSWGQDDPWADDTDAWADDTDAWLDDPVPQATPTHQLPAPHQDPPTQVFSLPEPPRPSFAAQQTFPTFTTGEPERGSDKKRWVLITIIAVLVMIAAALGTLFVWKNMQSDTEGSSSGKTKTVYVDENGNPIDEDDVDKDEKDSTKKSSNSTTSTAPRGSVPPNAKSCGTGGRYQAYSLTEMTSCPFAIQVATAAGVMADKDKDATEDVSAYSPVTQQHYTMQCRSLGHGDAECRGGNDAAVYLRLKD